MTGENRSPISQVRTGLNVSGIMRSAVLFAVLATLGSLLAALFLPRGYALASFGDLLQLALILIAAALALQNALRSHSSARIFWFLTFLGAAIWAASNSIWAFCEVWLKRTTPDAPLADILLFVKIVPLTTAFAATPHRERSGHFQTLGLLDVSVLMIYALYLYAFGVLSYRLLPAAVDTYNFRFNVADAIGNHILLIAAGLAFLSAHGNWRVLYAWYFFAAISYSMASNLSNVAIDLGRYYTGSLYDVPLVAALAILACVALYGRTFAQSQSEPPGELQLQELPRKSAFVSSHLAMLVMLSTPLIGLWLLSGSTAGVLLRFRLGITLVAMLLLTLLLSVKQDLLTAGLISSLSRLSETYSSIERFKSRLIQSETLASLGELVAEVANHIKQCMTVILDLSARLSFRPDADARVQGMAGKIGQYAQRTDALVENMLRFAQETPMRPAPLAVKPLLESALQLSRISKLTNIRVSLLEEGDCPMVMADSGQLLHVFLELLSNAVDALQEVNGGSLQIKMARVDSQLSLEFEDSGPGINDPARVFEPFYTTKVVGKGTGLGLSTCYGIVQQHGGEITCRNRLTGGACFTIRLPGVSQESVDKRTAPALLVDGAS